MKAPSGSSLVPGLCALFFTALPLAAQTVERDRSSGDFTVSYVGWDGESHTIVVPALDRVDPRIDVRVSRDGNLVSYHYTFRHLATPAAVQGVVTVDIPCTPEDPTIDMSRPDGWTAWRDVGMEGYAGCSFMSGESLLDPGEEETGFAIETQWRPGIGVARVTGVSEMFPVFPSGEDTPDEVANLVQRMFVPSELGNWKPVRTVAPTRPPDAFDHPSAGIRLVLDDLAQACGELGWIVNERTCTSLRHQFESGEQALSRGDTEAATAVLKAALDELDAQHGEEAKDQVSSEAYWLLATNIGFILGGIS